MDSETGNKRTYSLRQCGNAIIVRPWQHSDLPLHRGQMDKFLDSKNQRQYQPQRFHLRRRKIWDHEESISPVSWKDTSTHHALYHSMYSTTPPRHTLEHLHIGAATHQHIKASTQSSTHQHISLATVANTGGGGGDSVCVHLLEVLTARTSGARVCSKIAGKFIQFFATLCLVLHCRLEWWTLVRIWYVVFLRVVDHNRNKSHFAKRGRDKDEVVNLHVLESGNKGKWKQWKA
jgi:hypothetical protein